MERFNTSSEIYWLESLVIWNWTLVQKNSRSQSYQAIFLRQTIFFSSDISVHTPHQLVAVMRHFDVCQTPINNIKKKVVGCDFGCRLFGSCVWWAVSSVDHFSLLEGFCIYGAVSRVYRWITSLPLWGGCGEVGLPQCLVTCPVSQ